MYTMKADGVLFHNPAANDPSRMAMGTEAKFELNKAGSLTFTLPPDNVVYHALKKRKSVVQLYQDGEMLFQGRVIDTVSDLQNMQEVYCEGDLNLLMDSVQPAMDFDGTAEEYLRQVISNHNSVMEADKQFVVGTVTAVAAKHKVKVKSTDYTDTLGDLRSLLVDEFGGYLRVRYGGSTRYLDYIKEYTDYSGQSVKFGVNLVDIEKRVDTQKFFTILLPLGKVESGKRTTIAQVNGGSIYLEDVAAVSQYGRIIQTVMFEKVNDPQELLEKAQEYLARMRENRSVTVRAVDMKIVNPDIDSILLGDRVMLDSLPHDLNEYDICAKVVLLIDAPDQSEYTFGIPPDPLTDQVASRIKQTNKSVDNLKDWLTVTDTELILAKQWISEAGDVISNVLFKMDAMNANIQLKADQTVLTELETRVSNAEIMIDGANAAIDLKADRTTMTALETRMTAAEILIDGANAQIGLMAAQATVDALGERVTSAELLIDGQNSKIEAKADLILLDGYVKTTELEAEVLKVLQYADLSQADLDVGYLDASSAQISTLDTNSITTNSLTVGGVQFDPSDYATKAWVEDQGYLKNADFSNYATRSWVIEQNYTTASDVSQTLDNYVMQGELDDYATQTWVQQQGYAKINYLSAYAPLEWVNDQFSNLSSVYATRDWVTGTATAGLASEAWVEGKGYLTEIPTGYATQDWVRQQGYLTSAPGGYATQSWVIERGYVTASDVAKTLDGYVMKGELDDYAATKEWVEGKGYLTEIPAGYATEFWVRTQKYAKESALEAYATRDWVTGTATAGLASEAWVEGKGYLTEIPTGYATQDWVRQQGYLTSAPGGYATQSWVIERGYVTASDVSQTLDGYVMKGELDDYATQTWVQQQGYLKTVPSTYATTAWVNNQGFAKTTDLSAYATRDWVTGTATAGFATEAWVRENFSKASATYKPTVIERYGSVSGTSIPVQTLNESGTVLLTGTVDAGDVYNAGKNSVTLSAAGWQGGVNVVSASNGDSMNISLPSFSVSGGDSFSSNKTTVYFHTGSVNGPLASKEVDATDVYDSGYSAGNRAGFNSGYNSGYTAGQASIDTGAYYDEGYEIGYAAGFKAAKDAVKVTAGISWSNPAQYYAMVRYWGRATINGEEVGYAASSESKNISGYV